MLMGTAVSTAAGVSAAAAVTAGSIMSAGMAVVSGAAFTAAAGAAAVAGVAAAAFVGGVVGSAASQVVGKAMGVVEHFSMRQAVSSGIATVAAAGVGGALGGTGKVVENGAVQWANAGKVAVQGMAGYAGSYAGNKIAGQQASFSWGGVAASAVGSVVGQGLAQGAGFGGSDFGDRLVRGFMTGAATGAASRMLNRGGKVDYARVATDAFANEIGNEWVGAIMTPTPSSSAEATASRTSRGIRYLDTPENCSKNRIGTLCVDVDRGEYKFVIRGNADTPIAQLNRATENLHSLRLGQTLLTEDVFASGDRSQATAFNLEMARIRDPRNSSPASGLVIPSGYPIGRRGQVSHLTYPIPLPSFNLSKEGEVYYG